MCIYVCTYVCIHVRGMFEDARIYLRRVKLFEEHIYKNAKRNLNDSHVVKPAHDIANDTVRAHGTTLGRIVINIRSQCTALRQAGDTNLRNDTYHKELDELRIAERDG